MRAALKRQLFLAAALLGCCADAFGSSEPAGSALADELRAARLLTAAAQPGETEAIDRVYRDILRRHPDSTEAQNAWADHLWRTGRPGEAQAQWRDTLRQAPGNPDALDGLGHCELRLGNARAAIHLFSQATGAAPGNAAYHFNLANALYLFRREASGQTAVQALEQALLHFRQAARLEPLNISYARAYAETFYALEKPDWKEAAAAWERVLELSPDGDFALLHLARVSLERGERAAARDYLSRMQSSKHQKVKQLLLERAGEN